MARGLLLLLFVGAVGNASGSSLSCRERGFADALQCSGCKKMHDLVKDDGACVTTPDCLAGPFLAALSPARWCAYCPPDCVRPYIVPVPCL